MKSSELKVGESYTYESYVSRTDHYRHSYSFDHAELLAKDVKTYEQLEDLGYFVERVIGDHVFGERRREAIAAETARANQALANGKVKLDRRAIKPTEYGSKADFRALQLVRLTHDTSYYPDSRPDATTREFDEPKVKLVPAKNLTAKLADTLAEIERIKQSRAKAAKLQAERGAERDRQLAQVNDLLTQRGIEAKDATHFRDNAVSVTLTLAEIKQLAG